MKTKDYTLLALFIPFSIAVFFEWGMSKTETTPTYYNGQQLLPDYVHGDTLRVMNAEYLNEKIGAATSDGSIMELLNETCETEQEYRDNE